MNPSADLVNRLWRLCALLRKDGITYQQYVTELTYLLFLKMTHESGGDEALPPGTRWPVLLEAPDSDKLNAYKSALTALRTSKQTTPIVRKIFSGASTGIRESDNLARLIGQIDRIGWFSDHQNSFGDIYEGILERNAAEAKRGAGQYFTPRVLVDLLVDLMKPGAGEMAQDPAAGTGGFLTAANRYGRMEDGPCIVSGMENVPDTYRLLLMNLHMHGVASDHVLLGDTLSDDWRKLPPADVILTNPPFGPAGGRPTRTDLTVTGTVTSFALPFVEHCVRTLKPGGRSAIVVPDGILHEEGRGRTLRTFLMDECELHTILRLPSGIFYAQNVRTNVLFFNRRMDGLGTTEVYFYDLRSDMPAFSKSIPLARSHFTAFEEFYGDRADGSGRMIPRNDRRVRRLSRDEIRTRDEDLDVSWTLDLGGTDIDDASEPHELIAAAQGYLTQALDQIRALAEELDQSDAENAGVDEA
ncbi:MAG TPA: N-6 DNA methylase [Tianweitania sediminis]|nr:N-6 DNA methylase [Tianweitania sediminis]